MNTVKKGDRVLCVNLFGFNKRWNKFPFWNLPELGGSYTVSHVLSDGCVILAEVDNSHVNAILREFSIYEEANFYPWHFIKLKSNSVKTKEAATVENETSTN